jgi:protein transport protein SEC24
MATFYGNFFNRSSDLCAFPAFPRDQGYVVEVAIDESITKPVVSLQAAILHTTCHGISHPVQRANVQGNEESES